MSNFWLVVKDWALKVAKNKELWISAATQLSAYVSKLLSKKPKSKTK